ncbi:MAG: phosphatase PAP2 family protein [Thermoanaerobaculia bacterium]
MPTFIATNPATTDVVAFSSPFAPFLPWIFFAGFFLGFWLVFRFLLPVAGRLARGIWRRTTRMGVRWSWAAARVDVLRHQFGGAVDYLPIVILLAAAIGVAMVAGDGFLDLAEMVHGQSPALAAVDQQVHAQALYYRGRSATAFFTTMTRIGTPVGVGIITLAVGAVLMWKRQRALAIYLVGTALGAGLLDLELKSFFHRARPALAEALMKAHGFSFPSGHALGSTALYGALAWVVFRIASRWRVRSAAFAFATTMVLAISSSRLYLGVHWMSDIGAGIAAGLVWLIGTTTALEVGRRIRAMRRTRGPIAAEE